MNLYFVSFYDPDGDAHLDQLVVAETPEHAFALWRAYRNELSEPEDYAGREIYAGVYLVPPIMDKAGVIAWSFDTVVHFDLGKPMDLTDRLAQAEVSLDSEPASGASNTTVVRQR